MSFPKIIYGTAWKKQRTTSLVVSAVLQGFRAIDTACQPKHYQEKLVGEALQTLYSEHGIKREDLFLQTKYTSIDGQDTSQPLPYDPTASITDQVLQSFQTSLSNLQTTYLDSYILHSPLRTLQLTMEAWRVLMNLQDEGKVRLIGISNAYDKRVLEEIIKEGRMIDTVQNRWYEGNGWDAAVAQFCKEHGIYYQSFWTLSGSPTLLRSPAIKVYAAKHGCTEAQAVFRYAQSQGITPLAGSTNEGRMKDGVEAEKLEISEDEIEHIRVTIQNLAE